MKSIVEYATATNSEIKYLDQEVNHLLQRGFQPYGEPYVIAGEEPLVCQAMVRFEETLQ